MDLKLGHHAEDGIVVIDVQAEIDMYTAPRLRELLIDLVSSGPALAGLAGQPPAAGVDLGNAVVDARELCGVPGSGVARFEYLSLPAAPRPSASSSLSGPAEQVQSDMRLPGRRQT